MSLPLPVLLRISAEYGLADLRVPGAAAQYEREVTRSDKIETPEHYVGACRRLARRFPGASLQAMQAVFPDADPAGLEKGDADGRLIAVGFNHETPRQWVLGGGFWRFSRYYNQAVDRPDRVGSTYNADPEVVYAAFRAGVPARTVRAGLWTSASLRPISARRRRRLERATRAAGRTSAGMLGRQTQEPLRVTPAALSQLGRLSPELQRALIHVSGGLPDPLDVANELGGVDPLRPRDLRWDLLAPLARQVAADRTGRVRAAWATGKRFVALARAAGVGHPPDCWSEKFHASSHESYTRWDEVVRWLTPSYPLVSVAQARRIVRGESPVELSEGMLSRAEAHQWLSTLPHLSPLEWLQRRLPAEVPPLRDIHVVRWLLEVRRRSHWEQLTRVRRIQGPAGAVADVRFIDRLDEIMTEDLVSPAAIAAREFVPDVRARVIDVFARAAARSGEAWMEKARRDHRILASPPPWSLYPRSMRFLVTPAALAAEGDQMEHCVGGYSPAVESGKSVVVALRVGAERSTAEFDPRGRVLQHRGPRNSAPHPVLDRLLERFIRRAGLPGWAPRY